MPPLILTPGKRALIAVVASMNDFAYSACSSRPVATASTFGSNTMSAGSKPTCSVSRR